MQKDVKSPVEEITITGRLGGDPEKTLLKEKHVELVKFSLAVKGKDDTVPKWYDVAVYGPLMPATDKLKKGALVTLTGTLKTNTTDKKTFLNFTPTAIVNKTDQLYQGNLVEAPAYKETVKGPVLEFVIGYQGEKPEERVFKKMVFFKENAENFKALGLNKGDFVSVIGNESFKLNEYEKEGKPVKDVQSHVYGKEVKLLKKKAERGEKIEELGR